MTRNSEIHRRIFHVKRTTSTEAYAKLQQIMETTFANVADAAKYGMD